MVLNPTRQRQVRQHRGLMVAVASDDPAAPHHAVYQFGAPGLVACYAVMAGGISLVGDWLRSRHAGRPTR